MLILLLFFLFLVFLLIGTPVAFGLGIVSLIGMITIDAPDIALVMRMFGGVRDYPLLAIPFFVSAGALMNNTGTTERLLELADAFVGHLKSSLGQVNILASIFFAGVSGSDMADAVSIGSILIPSMKKSGYSADEAAVITAVSSKVGPIIPPSIRMIIYGSLTGTSILGLFLAGAIPGFLLGFSYMILTYFLAIKRPNSMGNPGQINKKFSFEKLFKSLKKNIFAIPIPLLVVGGIYGGFFTVTEAGAFMLLYVILVTGFIYKSLSIDIFIESMKEASSLTGLVGFIIATAYLFAFLLSVEGFSGWLVAATTPLHNSPYLLMLILVGIFILLGCFVPITAVLIVFAPFLPEFLNIVGFHPFHFATILMIALGVGAVTPPYGTILYVVADIADTSVESTLKTLWPYLLVFIIVLLIVFFVPAISLFLPGYLGF